MKRTTDKWTDEAWFGSLDSLADAADAAVQEVVEATPEDGRVTVYARVDLPGEYLEHDSLEEFREAIAQLERSVDEITDVWISVSGPNIAARLRASQSAGIRADVDGERAALVHGLTTTLERKLRPGVDRVRKQPLERRAPADVAVFGFTLVAAAGMAVLLVKLVIEYGFDLGSALLCVIVLLLVAFSWAQLMPPRRRLRPPHLELVPARDESAPAPDPDDRGPILRSRDWVRQHPIIGLIGSIAIAVVATAIANLIGL